MDTLEERTKFYIRIATEEVTLIKRLSGVGVLSREDTLRLNAVGPTARASGVPRDVRKDDPYAAYGELSFNVITDERCDVYARTVVRLKELLESFMIIRQVIAQLPEGPISVKAPRKIPAGESVSRYEAPRGEDLHYVKANGSDKPERVKVRAPTLANVQAVKQMLKQRYLADMPIVIAAIDPCFSCTDRTIRIRRADSNDQLIDWHHLHAQSLQWYRHRGIDFSQLNERLKKDL